MSLINVIFVLSKYGVFSGPYFPVFSRNTRKYGPEKPPYLDTFHGVSSFQPLTFITKSSILDVAAVLDPPLIKDTMT